MNIDEAMSAAMLGDKVTHDRLGRDTFVSYDFGKEPGYRTKHMKHFGEWASCSFIASDVDRAADWYVETREHCGECFGFVKEVWGVKTCQCTRKKDWAKIELNSDYRAVPNPSPRLYEPGLAEAVTMGGMRAGKTDAMAGFLAAQGASEAPPSDAGRDQWGNSAASPFEAACLGIAAPVDPWFRPFHGSSDSVVCVRCAAVHDAGKFTECQVCGDMTDDQFFASLDTDGTLETEPIPMRDSWGRIIN